MFGCNSVLMCNFIINEAKVSDIMSHLLENLAHLLVLFLTLKPFFRSKISLVDENVSDWQALSEA